ncbi:MAG TPA: hypothetical protein VFI31_13880 [Pirellulales bacterium]|nr:hypothetical protein [Pirellulales bacterium]
MLHNRRLTRCSRADVLWSILLFVAGQLGLALAIERWLPELRDPRYACRASQLIRRTAAGGPQPLSIVMLGSSRVQDGFDSTDLEAQLSQQFGRPLIIFNFGLPAAGPVANLLHFERMIGAGVKPDLLLVEVAPVLLGGQEGVPQEAGYFSADRLWQSELELVARYGLPADRLRRDWWENWFVPCHGHRSAIASRLLPDMLPPWLQLCGDREADASGWRVRNAQPLTAEDRRRACEYARNDFCVPLQSFQLCEAACRAQRDLLARCREEQIATALVWMPEGKTFQSWYPSYVEDQVRRHLRDLTAEFDVPLIEARDWADEDDFVDGHHLRHAGAVRFSQRLGREVLLPLLHVERERWDEYLASLEYHGHRPTASFASRPVVQERSGMLVR